MPRVLTFTQLGDLAGTKYTVSVHRRASDAFSLSLGSSCVDAVIRTLNDGGLLVQVSMLHCTALHCTALHCTALHCTTVLPGYLSMSSLCLACLPDLLPQQGHPQLLSPPALSTALARCTSANLPCFLRNSASHTKKIVMYCPYRVHNCSTSSRF